VRSYLAIPILARDEVFGIEQVQLATEETCPPGLLMVPGEHDRCMLIVVAGKQVRRKRLAIARRKNEFRSHWRLSQA
jgi:hypothetical protein